MSKILPVAPIVSMLSAALPLKQVALKSHINIKQDNNSQAMPGNSLSQEYSALMEQCQAAVLVVNEQSEICRANSVACKLMGITTRELTGRTLLEVTLSQALNQLARTARERRVMQRHQICIPEPDGSVLDVSIAPVSDSGPGKDLLLVVAQDVSDLRRLETIRRDFVANVSHELRTPLASIRAMAESLQNGALEDVEFAGRFLETIINESQRLSRISEDLLILSQAESREPEKSCFDMVALINRVVARFNPQAQEAGIALSASCSKALEVNANRDQFEQVLVNLVDNAIKYTPRGGSVIVSMSQTPDATNVKVIDTGIGILSKDLPRLFERFYRVDKGRSRSSGGTGLGLSIVKHIVEAHGGMVTVESEFNHGSSFGFSLPLGDKSAF